jgi:hypothetical protein
MLLFDLAVLLTYNWIVPSPVQEHPACTLAGYINGDVVFKMIKHELALLLIVNKELNPILHCVILSHAVTCT